MNNPFDERIQHNLMIGINNAISAIRRNEGHIAIEFLNNTKEMISLIDVEEDELNRFSMDREQINGQTEFEIQETLLNGLGADRQREQWENHR